MTKKPPFQITENILKKSQDVSYKLGILSGAKLTPVPIKLRRDNKIKTIQSSLGIEGNTLSIEQVTDLLEGKKVLGPKKDIQEVNNAIKVYADLSNWDPLSIDSLKRAHKMLIDILIADSGQWRQSGVGIFKGNTVVHLAPPAKRIPSLIADLFDFIKTDKSTPWLIKACIFHYEFEFIHPFQDGNGRVGRLWQQLLLMKENPIFEYISIESIVKSHQQEYYRILGECDSAGESTLFIEFSLETISSALQEYTESVVSQVNDSQSRLEYLKGLMGQKWFSRKEYMICMKNISTATASRDLLEGISAGLLTKDGTANQSKYKFK